MTNVANIPLLCIGNRESELVSLIPQLDQLKFTVSDGLCGFRDALDALKARPGPVVAIVDLGVDSDEAFLFAEEVKLRFPNVHMVMTSPESSSAIVLRALRSGAEEFLTQPFETGEVTHALEKVLKRVEAQPAQQQKSGQIVAVFSNKGGAGTTTVATNLAIALARRDKTEKSICLVDLDLQFGSVNSVLNLESAYTIVDIMKNLDHVDPLFLDGALGKHSSGVRVLAAPHYAEEAGRIAAADVESLLEVLVQQFDFVIVDCAKRIDDVSLTVLQKSRLIFFVMPMDVPSINLARKALDLFERARVPLDKCRLIVNRYVKSKELTLQSVEKALNAKVFHTLPLDYPVTIAALNQGVSLAEAKPNSKIAKSVQELAEELNRFVRISGHEDNSSRKRGLIGRWLPAFT